MRAGWKGEESVCGRVNLNVKLCVDACEREEKEEEEREKEKERGEEERHTRRDKDRKGERERQKSSELSEAFRRVVPRRARTSG